MQLSPVVLFVYNRLWHARQTIEALQRNSLAKESELFIFSDAPKNKTAEDGVKQVRKYIKTIEGFKSVTIVERKQNFGLSRSIVCGITQVVNRFGRVIIVEDDVVTSPYFLRYMNDGLSFYENEEKVSSICGYMYPIKIKNYETFLFRVITVWGWATWKRGWDLLQSDASTLLRNLEESKLTKKFDVEGAYAYTRMLKRQIKGEVDSWCICWYASLFLKGKLSLYPFKSLAKNIGFDCSGTNCGFLNFYNTELYDNPITVNKIPIAEDEKVVKDIKRFFQLRRLRAVKELIRRMFR
jgi:hypothetical protein